MNWNSEKKEKRIIHLKNIILYFIICVMFLFSVNTEINAKTVTGKNGKNLTWKIEDGVLTLSGKGAMKGCGHKGMKTNGDLGCYYENKEDWWEDYLYEVKSVVIEEGVTDIAPHAFSGLSNAKTITIPSSVKAIGHEAFDCSGFEEMIIPDSVTYMEKAAVSGCYDLKSVQLPQNIKDIPESIFTGCHSLKQISIPQTVKTIGNYAFTNCDNLENVNWEGKSKVQKIGREAFAVCNIKKLTIPATVKKIGIAGVSGTHAIQVEKKNKNYKSKNGVLFSKDGNTLVCYPYKKKGSSYKIPKGIKTIGSYAFSSNGGFGENNQYLKKVTMPDSITVVKKGAFDGAEKLKKVRFSKKLKRIEEHGFCCFLTSIKLPNSVEYIGKHAFTCDEIKGTIVIPKNVKILGYCAFTNAHHVKKIIVKSKKLKKIDREITFSRNKITIFLPKSMKEKYQKLFTKKKKNIKYVYQ